MQMESFLSKPEPGRELPSSEIPEAQNLTWADTFFDDDDDDIIAVFDFDYAQMEEFHVTVGYALQAASFLIPPVFLTSLVCCLPWCLRKRVQWSVYSQHLAVTRDGIRFVKDKRKTLCGCACTDAGKSSKTIPFDKITDCDIEEPGGNTCICVPNVLTKVLVDTASSGTSQDGVVRHELCIEGLKDPYKFKKLVWALKRSNGSTFSARHVVSMEGPQHELMARDDVTSLLVDIRDELRHLNQNLRTSQTAVATVSATTEQEIV
eukprot:CAMPEP_0118702312 /NCGR_PEP_ID=MMETSP0800-20121206/17813_1 /TAXON_ID=210618 ORGANISM="Striatella unipunctata, Strain CCMP2910" /NCGR_SAMPLE_ID=MMETSP0800 /ASSEMBLY_ACC=CAM_ASM_000638 /LENGTH=262 /DNA_ID=CAMNT_0006603483 /DNA_START=30 /DNA_END=818 /DNA_ORIENTATION=-